jgi:hypothetical protein
MEFIIGVLLVLFIIYIAIKSSSSSNNPMSRKQNPLYFYSKKESLMTDAETEFFRTLVEVAGDRYHVFPQVRLASLINNDTRGKYWKAGLSRINNKSVDYVLCDRTTLKAVYAVELDDPTHLTKKRQQRDAVVEQIFNEVQVPLVRFTNYRSLSNDDIAQRFYEASQANI